jgi:hypothetical protein
MRIAWFILLCAACIAPAAGPGRVAVVYRSGTDGYNEAVAALRIQLGSNGLFLDLSGPVPSDIEPALAGAYSVVAVGEEALRRLDGRSLQMAVVSSMLMRDQASSVRITSPRRVDVVLDTPLDHVVEEIGRVLGRGGRLGILHSPAQPLDRSALAASARHHGFTLVFSECRNAAGLLRALRDLKPRADWVLCLPDGTLYNSATVRPLIMASLELGLPLVGFSPGFVKAGAALGVYPDFAEIGRQAAEIARAGEGAGDTVVGPRKLTTAVNQRVLRLLGMPQPASKGLVVYR